MNDNPLYLRQQELEINTDQHVAVIGCGGVGSWMAMFLALAGIDKIDLYDPDNIESHNLNRFPVGPEAIGQNKAVAIADLIVRLRADCQVTPRAAFDAELHSQRLNHYDWVIVTTDSLKSRRMVYAAAKESRDIWGLPKYIECGADGTRMTVAFQPAEFATDLEDNPGYQSVPVFVGPCTMAASIAAYYVLKGYEIPVSHVAEWSMLHNMELYQEGLRIQTNDERVVALTEPVSEGAAVEADNVQMEGHDGQES